MLQNKPRIKWVWSHKCYNYLLLCSSCSTAVEHMPAEYNSRGCGFESSQVMGFSSSLPYPISSDPSTRCNTTNFPIKNKLIRAAAWGEAKLNTHGSSKQKKLLLPNKAMLKNRNSATNTIFSISRNLRPDCKRKQKKKKKTRNNIYLLKIRLRSSIAGKKMHWLVLRVKATGLI